jgi:hypothetical protein
VSADLVQVLREQGLSAVRGFAPDFPWERESPFAISFFEVLEHLPQPHDVIAPLRERFPDAVIVATVPSPRRAALRAGTRSPSDYPPNHFLRWTPLALERFFRRVGYARVDVSAPPPLGSDVLPGFAQVVARARNRGSGTDASVLSDSATTERSRLAATAIVLAHRLYQAGADVIGAPAAARVRRRGVTGNSLLVIARP